MANSYSIRKRIHGGDTSQLVADLPCTIYNISVMRGNPDTIYNLTHKSCDPWNIRHLIKEAPHPILSIININLNGVPNI